MLTLQDIIKIQLDEQNKLKALQNNVADINKEVNRLLFENGEKSIAKFKKLDLQQKQEYKKLANDRKALEEEAEKQQLIVLFVNEYVKNIKIALAYNYYISELQQRPKIHNKPLHYKIVKNALRDICDSMPAELTKTSFYNLEFQYNGFKAFYDLLTDNCIDQAKLIKIDINIVNPVALANDNYNTYCKIFDILKNAYKQVNELENTLAENKIMQYNYGSISNEIIDAARCLPWIMYRDFK